METLDNERLSAAEKVFTLVAMLRTAKVGSCIVTGPDTSQLFDILDTDQRVWLVGRQGKKIFGGHRDIFYGIEVHLLFTELPVEIRLHSDPYHHLCVM